MASAQRAVQKWSTVESDLYGRQTAAHIRKGGQHFASATQLLKEGKAKLPHGQFLPWLDEHKIARRTAQRLLLEDAEPVVKEKRQAAGRQREATVRAAAKAPHVARMTQSRTPEPAVSLARVRLQQLVARIPDAKIPAVIAAIEALLRS